MSPIMKMDDPYEDASTATQPVRWGRPARWTWEREFRNPAKLARFISEHSAKLVNPYVEVSTTRIMGRDYSKYHVEVSGYLKQDDTPTSAAD